MLNIKGRVILRFEDFASIASFFNDNTNVEQQLELAVERDFAHFSSFMDKQMFNASEHDIPAKFITAYSNNWIKFTIPYDTADGKAAGEVRLQLFNEPANVRPNFDNRWKRGLMQKGDESATAYNIVWCCRDEPSPDNKLA